MPAYVVVDIDVHDHSSYVDSSPAEDATLRRDGYRVQDTPAGAPVGAPIRTAGDASF